MAFTSKVIHKDDDGSEKYFELKQRYINEVPKDIMKKHNYQHNQFVDMKSVNLAADDERNIYLVLIHFEDCREYETPMSWVLFLENQMILFNCDSDDKMGVFEDGSRWRKEAYLVEPLHLPKEFDGRENEVKEYISEALDVFPRRGGMERVFSRIDVSVIFDMPYTFIGDQR